MVEKYIITIGEIKFVMKYKVNANELQIGGHGKFSRTIEKFISEELEYEIPENNHSQPGKVRFDFAEVEKKDFRKIQDHIDALDYIEMDGPVESHGRLM